MQTHTHTHTHTHVHAPIACSEPLAGKLNISPNYFNTNFCFSGKEGSAVFTHLFLSRLIIMGKGWLLYTSTHSAEGRESPGHVASLSQS